MKKPVSPAAQAAALRAAGVKAKSVGEILDAAPIGHNNPPSPFDEAKQRIEDLRDEAQNWLDGDPIASDAQAAQVAKLLNQLREARKFADEARKAEKAPFDAGAQEVQDRYNPLLKRADQAALAAKGALTPWTIAQEKRLAEAAAEARAEADRVNAEAAAAAKAARSEGNLAAIEKADEELEAAALREKEARRIEAAKPQVRGGGRTVSLRTVRSGKITDRLAFGRWVWSARPIEMDEFLERQAKLEAALGTIAPGLEIIETKVAV